MRRANQKGTILITLIVAMLLIGVLGAGIYRLTTSSTFTGLLSNRNDQAYNLAQAGVRYAIDKIIQQGITDFASTDFFLPDSNNKFNISIASRVITSIGIVNAGTFSETRRRIIYSWPASLPVGGTVITATTDAFTPKGGGTTPTGAITVASNGTISLGGNAATSYGTVLYQGSSSVYNCIAGACNFTYGLRAYFQFISTNEDSSTDSTAYGDGFTFAVLSAINNTRDRTGGGASGELMGYAGPGNAADGLGLKPPKMAMEFDTYANAGVSGAGCNNGRNDTANNHMALLFWGADTAGLCGTYPASSYDDNVHGAGDGTTSNPYNSAASGNGSGLGGYYEGTKSLTTTSCNSAPTTTCNWMEDGHKYSFRLEVVRIDGTGNPANGLYQINGWIYRDSDSIPTGFNDVTNSFDAAPLISRTVTLSATNHAALQRVYFGFTEATGSKYQNIQISNLKVFFPQTLGACTYYINPTSASYALAGGSGSVLLTMNRPDCTWTAVSNNTPWLTVTGGASGTGNGSVSYTVAANTGLARTGTITIGGMTFTVTQTGCTYTLTPTSRAHTSAAATLQLITVTASSGTCTWTATSSDLTWLTVTSYTGTGSGTVRYSITANTGPARTGYIYIGDQTFTVTQASGCTYAINPTSRAHSSNAASGQTVAVTAGTSCPWTAVSNNAWITVTGGASGTGNDTVTYSITANATGAIRTGTITIGGQTFTVTQAYLCPGYRVWNNTGNQWDFQVTGQACHTSVNSGSEITTATASTQLQTGERVNRYTTAGGGCSSAVQGYISYTDAVNADINGNCRVNYNAGDVAGDR